MLVVQFKWHSYQNIQESYIVVVCTRPWYARGTKPKKRFQMISLFIEKYLVIKLINSEFLNLHFILQKWLFQNIKKKCIFSSSGKLRESERSQRTALSAYSIPFPTIPFGVRFHSVCLECSNAEVVLVGRALKRALILDKSVHFLCDYWEKKISGISENTNLNKVRNKSQWNYNHTITLDYQTHNTEEAEISDSERPDRRIHSHRAQLLVKTGIQSRQK